MLVVIIRTLSDAMEQLIPTLLGLYVVQFSACYSPHILPSE